MSDDSLEWLRDMERSFRPGWCERFGIAANELEHLRKLKAMHEQWFADNAVNLAVHRIGGFRLGD